MQACVISFNSSPLPALSSSLSSSSTSVPPSSLLSWSMLSCWPKSMREHNYAPKILCAFVFDIPRANCSRMALRLAIIRRMQMLAWASRIKKARPRYRRCSRCRQVAVCGGLRTQDGSAGGDPVVSQYGAHRHGSGQGDGHRSDNRPRRPTSESQQACRAAAVPRGEVWRLRCPPLPR